MPAARPAPSETQTLTVWYDGDCPICAREIGVLRRFDAHGRIAFVDLSVGGDCPADRLEMLARLHAQTPGGPLITGVSAFIAIWSRLPGFRPLARLAAWSPASALLAAGYEAFLSIRPALQRLARAALGPLPRPDVSRRG